MIILPIAAKNAKKAERNMRPVKIPRSVRKNYLDLLDQQVRYLKAQTANLSDLLSAGADRSTVASTLAQMAQQAQARMEQLAPQTARSFVTAADVANKTAMQNNIASALSVDFATVIDGPDIKPIIDQALVDNANLIKSISQEHFAKVSQAVLDNYRGVPLPDNMSLAQRLQKIGTISKNRAKFIARDQTAKLTGDLNQARQADNGIDEYYWKNSQDRRVVGNPSGLYPKGNRVHGDHWDREDVKYSWSAPPHDGHPGHAPNCFTGSTVFDLSNGCDKLWRRHYAGRLSVLLSSDGASLKATPNHPILTGHGWKAIDLLEKGDDIIKPVAYRSDVVESDIDQFGASIEQVFDFMAAAATLTSSSGSKLDFHKDGSESNVDTVLAESFLSGDFVTAFLERSSKFGFAKAFVDLEVATLDALRPHYAAIRAVLHAAHRRMSIGGKSHSLGRGELAHPDDVCLATGSSWDQVVRKYSGDNATGNAIRSGELKLADSFGVQVADLELWKIGDSVVCRSFISGSCVDALSAELFAEIVRITPKANAYFFEGDASLHQRFSVVEKGFCEFSGHVYNIQTKTGWYHADNVVSHNCRCYAKPVLNIEKLKAQYV